MEPHKLEIVRQGQGTPPPVRNLSRESFLRKFTREWEADQHVSLIGPTGRGKTYTARQLLERRDGKVLILAPKGVDKTLTGFGEKIEKWPPVSFDFWNASEGWPGAKKDPANAKKYRLEPKLNKPEDMAKMRGYFADALRDVFRQQHWTVYCDELQVTADPRMMGLGKLVESILLMGRSREVSMVSSIQVPRWAPRAAYDQASHVLLWRQRDKPARDRIGEISGVDTRAVIETVVDLDFHEFLWVDATKDKLYRVAP